MATREKNDAAAAMVGLLMGLHNALYVMIRVESSVTIEHNHRHTLAMRDPGNA